MKRVLWLLTGFGFFGLWKILPTPNADKTGLYSVTITFFPGLSMGGLRKIISWCQHLKVDKFMGVPMDNGYYLSSNWFSKDVPVRNIIDTMYERERIGIRFLTDKKGMMFLAKRTRRLKTVRFNWSDITQDTMIRVEDAIVEETVKSAAAMVNSKFKKGDEGCPNCDEPLLLDTEGDCSHCCWNYLSAHYNIDKMVALVKKGKPLELIAA